MKLYLFQQPFLFLKQLLY